MRVRIEIERDMADGQDDLFTVGSLVPVRIGGLGTDAIVSLIDRTQELNCVTFTAESNITERCVIEADSRLNGSGMMLTGMEQKVEDENHRLRIIARRWAETWSEDTGQDMPSDDEIFGGKT